MVASTPGCKKKKKNILYSASASPWLINSLLTMTLMSPSHSSHYRCMCVSTFITRLITKTFMIWEKKNSQETCISHRNTSSSGIHYRPHGNMFFCCLQPRQFFFFFPFWLLSLSLWICTCFSLHSYPHRWQQSNYIPGARITLQQRLWPSTSMCGSRLILCRITQTVEQESLSVSVRDRAGVTRMGAEAGGISQTWRLILWDGEEECWGKSCWCTVTEPKAAY